MFSDIFEHIKILLKAPLSESKIPVFANIFHGAGWTARCKISRTKKSTPIVCAQKTFHSKPKMSASLCHWSSQAVTKVWGNDVVINMTAFHDIWNYSQIRTMLSVKYPQFIIIFFIFILPSTNDWFLVFVNTSALVYGLPTVLISQSIIVHSLFTTAPHAASWDVFLPEAVSSS